MREESSYKQHFHVIYSRIMLNIFSEPILKELPGNQWVLPVNWT